MTPELPDLALSLDNAGRPIVAVDSAHVATLPALVAAAPALAEPAQVGRYCEALNHLKYGYDYRVIHDPDAYRARYEARLNAEDPDAPFQENVVRMRDFGKFDTSEIRAPRRDNGAVVFYVEDGFLGIPYRVTAPSPDHPEGDSTYDPLPVTALPPARRVRDVNSVEPVAEMATVTAAGEEAVAPQHQPAPEVTPDPSRAPTVLELLARAVSAGDLVAGKRQLLALEINPPICDRIVAAWETIADRSVPLKQRQATMLELISAIREVRSVPAVMDELWRLQQALLKHT